MILLTTPFDPGDLDPGASYTHVEIAEVTKNQSAQYMRVKWLYGTADEGGNFTPGVVHSTTTIFLGENYEDFCAISTGEDATCVAAFDRAVAQALIDRGTIAGEVV